MKILFVNPSLKEPDKGASCWPPLGLAYLAAQAEKMGHEVSVADRGRLLARGYPFDFVDNWLRQSFVVCKPDMVAITATTPLIPDAYHVARMVKKYFPKCQVILGGPHASALPEQTAKECPQIDIIVCGEGERVLCEIIKEIENGRK